MKNNEILVKGINVKYQAVNQEDYICLTDIARVKNPIAPADVVKNWFRTRSAIDYMGIWEKFYNPNVKVVEIDQLLNKCGEHAFTLSPQQWIEKTNALGVTSKSGKGGGTCLSIRSDTSCDSRRTKSNYSYII